MKEGVIYIVIFAIIGTATGYFLEPVLLKQIMIDLNITCSIDPDTGRINHCVGEALGLLMGIIIGFIIYKLKRDKNKKRGIK